MKLFIRHFNKGFAIYIFIIFLLMLAVSSSGFSNNKSLDLIFTLGHDFGNFVVMIMLLVYAFFYSKVKDKGFRSLILKNLIKTILLIIILDFSTVIVGVFLDILQLVQSIFYNAYYNTLFVKLIK